MQPQFSAVGPRSSSTEAAEVKCLAQGPLDHICGARKECCSFRFPAWVFPLLVWAPDPIRFCNILAAATLTYLHKTQCYSQNENPFSSWPASPFTAVYFLGKCAFHQRADTVLGLKLMT